jgi:hypothetical protein
MAQTETYQLNIKTNASEALDEVNSAVKDLKGGVDEAGDAVSQLGETLGGAGNSGEKAMGVLDQATGGLVSSVKGLVGGVKSFGKSSIAAFKASTAGANGLKKALISTGIGALVVALGLVVAYWDDIVGYISGASKEQKDLLAATEKTVAASQQALENTEASENSLKLAGKSEREIRNLKIQQTNELIKQTEIQLAQQKALRESQIAAAERNQKIAAGIIAFITLPITALLATIDLAAKGLAKLGLIKKKTNLVGEYTKGGANLLGFDPEKVTKEGDEAIAATEVVLRKLKNQRDGYILQNQNEDEQAAKNAADAEAKAAEELAALKKEIAEAEVNTKEEIRAKELEDVQKHYDDLIEQAKANGLDTTELELTKGQVLAEIRNKNRQEDLDAEQEYQDKLDAIAQQEADERRDRNSDRLMMVADTFDAMSALADAFAGESEEQQRRNFAIQKALSSASTIVSTIEGAQNAFSTAQKSPLTAVFPAYPFVQAGLATAFGIAQLKKIQSQQFESSSTPDSTSAPRGGAPAGGVSPRFNLVGGSGVNAIAQSLANTPIKAYVVGSEVTSQQQLDRNRVKSATF